MSPNPLTPAVTFGIFPPRAGSLVAGLLQYRGQPAAVGTVGWLRVIVGRAPRLGKKPIERPESCHQSISGCRRLFLHAVVTGCPIRTLRRALESGGSSVIDPTYLGSFHSEKLLVV